MARVATKAQLQEALYQSDQTIQLLEERFAELELAVEDAGWVRLASQAQREFSREGLRKITLMAVMAYLKNPLIRHATDVQAHYVWGQGVTIHSPDPGVNKVVQSFLKDRRNRKVLTGKQAQSEKEVELQTKSNLFIVLFTNQLAGKVQVRTFPVEECEDVIRNPDDAAEPWYYVRQYNRMEFNPQTGRLEEKKGVREYYPDWLYDPQVKPASFGESKVLWDSPVYHVAVGRLGDMRFGIPEHYASLDWAMAVKNDLEDYATIRRALARFAFKLTVTGPNAVKNAKTKMGTTLGANSGASALEKNPPATAGSTWIQQAGQLLEPIRTAGAQPNPEEGRRLWLMVSAGTGIPETILTGDSSVGNYATSRTLDRPTELKMQTRQELWADVYRDILTFVVRKARRSVDGPISSLPQVVEAAVREAQTIVLGEAAIVNLGAGTDANVDLEEEDVQINVDFPAILEHDILPRVQAVVQAATLNGQQTAGTMSDRTLIGLLFKALNVDNADALLDELLPEGAEYFDTEEEESPGVDQITGAPLPVPPKDSKVSDNEVVKATHKVAPPPPSMRNEGNSGPADPFTTGAAQQGPTGGFQSDKDSQRMRGTTPPRGKK